MACVELHLGPDIIQIKNGQEGDLNSLLLVSNFLNSNAGFIVTVNGEEQDPTRYQQDLIELLLGQIDKLKTTNQAFALTHISQEDFIDNLIGNYNIKNVVGENVDEVDSVLYNPTWGSSSNWLGFTEHRMVYITGEYPKTNYRVKSLYNIYNNIKTGDKKTIKLIHDLYIKLYGKDKSNVYQKLTRLANDKSAKLSLYTYINTRIYTEGKTVNEYVEQNIDFLNNIYFNIYENDDPIAYQFILKNSKIQEIKNQYVCKNILTGEIKYIPKTKVKRLYGIISTFKKTNYSLINNTWYSNSQPVDEKTSQTLFEEYFGYTKDFHTKIDFKKDNINIQTKVNDSTLNDLLPIGSRVRTSSKIYTKSEDGIFRFGDEELDMNDKIYEISFVDKNNIAPNIASLKDNEQVEELSENKIKVILIDNYDFTKEDIESLWFVSDYEASTALVGRSKQGNLYLKIKKYLPYDDSTLKEIHCAAKFFKYIKQGNSWDKKAIEMYWRLITNNAKESDLKKYDPVILSELQKEINNPITINDVKTTSVDQITNISNFAKQLIDSGIMTISCEI